MDASDLDHLLQRPSGQPLLEDLGPPNEDCFIKPRDGLPSDLIRSILARVRNLWKGTVLQDLAWSTWRA